MAVVGLLSGACAAFSSGSGSSGSGASPERPPAGDVESDEEGDEAAATAAEEPTAEAPVDLATEMVRQECEALCKRAAEVCSEAEARRCQDQCKIYLEQSVDCEVPYKAALKCQAKSNAKELCANVESPTCVEQFRRIARCKQQLEEEAAKAKQPALPAGWAPLTDDRLHFKIALPASAALDPDAKRRTWRAQDGGVEYIVAELPAPGKAITSPVLLDLVIELVGISCQKNLKLYGQFEIKDEVAIRFDTQCKDGGEWHGMLRVRPDQALVTAFRGPVQGGVLEPFIYSYKRLN